MTADPTTRIAQVREQISALTDQGFDSVDIAARLGTTVSRVDQVLDQLEGAHLAALPPVTPPIRHPAGPPAPKLPSIPVPKQEVPAPASVPKPPRRWGTSVCGTSAGFQTHKRHGEEPCEPCKEGRRTYMRGLKRGQRAKPAKSAEAKPKVQVHWLIPRGATMDGAHLEYAVLATCGLVPCSFDTAELAAAHDETVMSRWATDWVDAR